jgi:AmiR/NasT family two-component response regulator
VTTRNHGVPTRAEMEQQIDHLQQRVSVDRELIAHLEAEEALDREKIANLEIALVNARRIWAAMGILIERRKISDEDAFDLLRMASQRTHRKLRDVAEDLIFTGTFDVD